MGTMKGDDLRDLLLLMMRDQDKMTYEQFEHFYLEIIDVSFYGYCSQLDNETGLILLKFKTYQF